jgi:hypothetical protein
MNFGHHKYEWTKPFNSVRHNWSLIGPKGAINFHVTISEQFGDSAGLEIHRLSPAEYQRDDPPSHLDCWLLKAPCWHDGTSLYANETLWPMLKPMLMSGDHECIFRFLESEARERFHCAPVDGEGP